MDSQANNQLIQRIDELEIQVAFQEELVHNLSTTIARLQQQLDLQQAQLRLLYQRLPEKSHLTSHSYSPAEEVPPHY